MSIPNAQLLFDGIISGLAVALLAVAILLVYRANRVINFAVADMGAVGATLFAVLNVRFGGRQVREFVFLQAAHQ